MRTERDLWAAPRTNFHVWAWHRQAQKAHISLGLRALAETWFDDYEDETELPQWFRMAVNYAEEQHGELDVPHLEDCPECEGSGEIHWNPSKRNDPQFVEDGPCPTCSGTGCV